MSEIIDPGAIAESLRRRAEQLALDVEHCEELVARLPPCMGLTRDLEELRRDAVHLALAHVYFQELAERPETPVVFERRHYPAVGGAP